MITRLLRKTTSAVGRIRGDKKGAAMVEYAILVAGIALVSLVAVSLLGHKVNDMFSSIASILPGAHAGDNGPLVSGNLVEAAPDANGNITLDTKTIVANNGTERLGNNLGVDLSKLVVEPK
jgi:pilus assembly protein Flp/PilA